MSDRDWEEYIGCCGSCEYFPSDGKIDKNVKVWCEESKTYVYPDDKVDNYICRHFEPRKKCWLTSACCSYKGLSDDCEELTTLREFRDQVLINMPDGKDIINTYYEEAPRIVKQIDLSSKKDELYEFIYEKIQSIINKINLKLYEQAVIEYLYMTYIVDIKSRNKREER